MKKLGTLGKTVLILLVIGVLVLIFTSPDTLKMIIDNAVVWVQDTASGGIAKTHFVPFGTRA